MNFKKRAFIFSLLVVFITCNALACSMYKLTAHGKTMLGSNYDAYFTTAKIWFENAAAAGECGAVFTGGNPEGAHGNRPQSGMNACGIAFTGAAVEDPILTPDPSKKHIDSPAQYLKGILHACKSLDEVAQYIAQYDRSTFAYSVFLYTDTLGNYLIVEPDTIMRGHDPKLVLSNFCPSTTSSDDARKLARYRNGLDFRGGAIDTSLAFCTALSDTMHVCRARKGDGTLLTTIWDPQLRKVHLYFYHDFAHRVTFDLDAELAKGDHVLDIPGLFPPNGEYETLLAYRTPQNTPIIRLFLMLCAVLFVFTSSYFGLRFLRRKQADRFAKWQGILFPLGLVLAFYMYILATNIYIFYFPAPFQDAVFSIQNIAAYTPFLLMLLILPMAWATLKVWRVGAWSIFPKLLLTANNFTYWVLMIMFIYWGLLGVN